MTDVPDLVVQSHQVDVSEETSYDRTVRELERLVRINKTFLSVINHEMRTPLTAIMGFTELLLATEHLHSDAADMVNMIQRNSERLLRLVNDVLDLAHLENGNLLVVRQEMSILGAVERSLSALKPLVDKKQIEVLVDISPGVPDVYADPDRVDQILTNLLSNATKYTPCQGMVTVTVR